MANEPANPVAPDSSGRAIAPAEVVAVFAAVHISYRAFKHFTGPGMAEAAAGLNFSPGLTMILASVALIVVSKRRAAEYGLTLRGWPYCFNLGLLWGVVPVAAAAVVFALGRFHPDPGRAPPTGLALIAAVGELLFTAILLRTASPDGGSLRRIPPLISLTALLAIACLPVLASLHSQRPALHAIAVSGELLLCAGLGEEIFFRGYVQSRLNRAFGRPFRLLGAAFGPGLVVSSLLFGAIHALNTVDYFAGRFEFAWSWGVMNVCTGLFLGFMREKTGSILPGAVAHGVRDILLQVPAFLVVR